MNFFHFTIKKILYSTLFLFLGLSVFAQTNSMKERVSSIQKQLTTEEKINLLCAKAPAIKRLNIPAYDWWSECLHGVARAGRATVFPKPIGMGCMWDDQLVEKIGAAISDEARVKYHAALKEKGYTERYEGLTYFSPTVNIARDPRWGRTSECFSEDPLLTGESGAAFVKGLQGNDPTYLKLVATPKHFVANNEENRRLDGSADVDEVSLREYYFPGFRTSVQKGKATSIMGAYNALNGVPSCANHFLLTEVLRDEWGFDGVVMSDGSAIARISSDHKYKPTSEAGAAAALQAGCDMSLRDEYHDGLRKALVQGLITIEDIDTAVERVLMLRMRLGMFDADEKVPYAQLPDSLIECAANRLLALEAARKSIVLLKNDGILPLDPKKVKKVALIGEAFKRVYYGDYSGLPTHNLTLWETMSKDAAEKGISISWVSDSFKEQVVPTFHLIRPEEYAYEGRLGLTGKYFDSCNIGASANVTRHDLALDLSPYRDEQINKFKNLSAYWETSLNPPSTGEYTLQIEGECNAKIFIDGKEILNQKIDKEGKASSTIALKAGGYYNLRIECSDMQQREHYRFCWKLPSDKNAETPESLAKKSDAVIIFLRDDAGSEGRDRETLAVDATQAELVDKVTRANKNTVLVMGGSTPLLLGGVSQQVKALLNVWLAGQGEAEAVAEILFGKVNPSGKTSVTFFTDEKQLPALDNYDVTKGRSYQYFDGDVLYPFGYGLSYTTYAYGQPKLINNKISKDDTLKATVKISNDGQYDGEEVVQCYISSPEWLKGGLKKKLVAYKRIFLKKGQSKNVVFDIPAKDFARWDINEHKWEVKSGDYNISVTPNSATDNSSSFTVN